MFSDRRGAPRRKLSSAACIKARGDARPQECRLIDISSTGVRLYCEAQTPDRFALLVPEQPARECRVVWRLGYELGAEFLG
jgi:hypothetical protein